jgi:hypothetical protein
MCGHGGSVRARGFYQLPTLQLRDRTLHCAFGKTGFIGHHSQAGLDRSPALPGGPPGKIKINQEGSRLLIMPDDIAHEHVENIIIDWNGSVKARHHRILSAIPINGHRFLD